MKLENRYFFEIEKEMSSYYKDNNINLNLRNRNDEYEYIWQILLKYKLAIFVNNEMAVKTLKYCIDRYGFIEVQQMLREVRYLKGEDRYYFGIHLRRKLEELDEEQRRKYIPAAIDAEAQKLNEKLYEELNIHHEKMLVGKQNNFNNFEPRSRSVDNSDGYWNYDEIENALLGWEDIEIDKNTKED